MFTDHPTLTREIQRLMSTGRLPRDALDAFDDASDGDTELASDDEEHGEYMAQAKALIDEEADKARRLRVLVAYDDSNDDEPEPEDDGGGEPDPDFVGPRATTNHVHYNDDVRVINADQCYYSSSSLGSGSPSGTNSDRSSSPERFDDQDEQLAHDEEKHQQRIAEAQDRPYSPTPDVDGIPHFASEDIDMNSAYTHTLELKSDDDILAGFFGEGHGAVLSNIHPTPPPPTSTGQNPPPAPPAPAPAERMAIRPELAKRLEEVTRPRNLLKRTMNGDAYIPDGAGGFMSARTGRHVDQAFAGDFLQRQEDNTLRNLAERINAGQVVVTVVQDDPPPPTSPASDDSNSQDAESVEEQLDAADSEEEVAQQVLDAPTPPTRERAREESVETVVNDEGDCSPSDEEVAQQVLDAPTPPTRKRAREESSDSEDNDGDDASLEKRRRVQSEEQPGSRAVLRLRSRAPSPSPALGSSTAATQTTLHIHTAAAAAPHADGPVAVVEPTQCAANGSDETSTASTSVSPAAEPAPAPAPSANVPARRSTRARAVVEAARVRAAEAARRAAEASPVPKPRGKGKGKGKGRGRA